MVRLEIYLGRERRRLYDKGIVAQVFEEFHSELLEKAREVSIEAYGPHVYRPNVILHTDASVKFPSVGECDFYFRGLTEDQALKLREHLNAEGDYCAKIIRGD